MNYRWEGGETLDGIVRVVECGGDSRKWPPFSPTQLRYFVLERSLSTEARFVSSFTLGETGFEASVLLRSHAMREHTVDYSARFCCQLLVSIPGTFLYIYIYNTYIYVYTYTSPLSSAKTVSTVPTHFTYHLFSLYRRCSKLLRHRV